MVEDDGACRGGVVATTSQGLHNQQARISTPTCGMSARTAKRENIRAAWHVVVCHYCLVTEMVTMRNPKEKSE